MIFIVVKFTVRPEFRDQWLDRLSGFTEATRREPGNLWFEWSRSVDDPDRFVLLEAFHEDAAAAHVESDHFAEAMRIMPTMLAETPDIVNVTTPGEGWSKMAELTVTPG
ncbi:quinol monooxygenase YgiN [Stackebrandtia albiflava]|uniref:Quinol monooxygenase YgiN n=1 Tax=Stackebrandtia albiflava TaxID=406432 RepID=A0A562V445_9ACTN|nr:quinol monooxygenase YgiN [Stackebrandtia albiflava]